MWMPQASTFSLKVDLYMREGLVHGAWIVTNFLRTRFHSDDKQSLYMSLASEVKILEAELHRAHRLIEG